MPNKIVFGTCIVQSSILCMTQVEGKKTKQLRVFSVAEKICFSPTLIKPGNESQISLQLHTKHIEI